MARTVLSAWLVYLLAAASVMAQEPAPAPAPAGNDTTLPPFAATSVRWEQVEPGHYRYEQQVAFEPSGDLRIFADTLDLYTSGTPRLVASGNVTFTTPEGRISADRVEFDLKANTGTFHDAWGLMSLGPKADRTQFGNQDPDVMFYGQEIVKLGPERYTITRGGFTTCVQPTPRWEVTSRSVTLNLHDYAVARNTLLRVKGVPLFYLPILYYPINDEERSTGFLMPTYGSSTLRGQSISNAFFWAINRSQDATLFHDWFTSTGQGMGAEYRYVSGPLSSGNVRYYRLAEKTNTITSGTETSTRDASTSSQLTGTLVQQFGRAVRARARLDYFTSLTAQQLYNQNLYTATSSSRAVEAGISGPLGPISASAVYQRSEVFSSVDERTLYGSLPRLTGTLAPQRLGGSPAYLSLTSEYAFLPYQRIVKDEVTLDNGFGRVDVSPSIRLPLSRLTYLSVNTNAAYRTTYYTRSFDALDPTKPTELTIVDRSFNRNYFSVRTDVVGPVLTKIWDTPESSHTERMKHVIEPSVSVQLTSPIDDYTRTPYVSDQSDVVIGGEARVIYGVTNRLFYRGRAVDGQPSSTREFVTVGVQQTYYSNPLASQYDSSYRGSYGVNRPIDLSPIAITGRVSPSAAIDATTRVEYDVYGRGLQVLSAGGGFNLARASTSVTFSHTRITPTSTPDNYLTGTTRLNLLQRRVIGGYSLSWDIERGYLQSQLASVTYMAQCCGVQAEFQKYSIPPSTGVLLPNDMRFNLSFVLAGVGTFSNFLGAFGAFNGQR